MELTRIDRKYLRIPLTAKLADGTSATVTGVDVALLPPRKAPTTATVWTAATYADGIARILVAGPDADATGALVVPAGGATVWVRVIDTPEVDAAEAGYIAVR